MVLDHRARAQVVLAVRCGVVLHEAQWWLKPHIGSEKMNYEAWLSCHYNETSKGTTAMRSPLGWSLARRELSGERKGNDMRWMKGGRGWGPSAAWARGRCEEPIGTLDRRWAAQWGGAHHRWWVAFMWSDEDSRWWRKLGQNNSTTKGFSYVGWIKEWRGEMLASMRWRLTSASAKKLWKGLEFRSPAPFIGRGERERAQ
jgi:hypothetical protein